MDLDWNALIQALLRWGHIVAGILWIGMLYFFNFVNGPFAGTMDKETKGKVVPELMPRALFWFRWGAAWTWITGFLLLGLIYHASKSTMYEPGIEQGPAAGVLALVLMFVAPFLYDVLQKGALGKNNKNFAILCFVLTAAVLVAFVHLGHMTYRAASIHIGGIFGTIMAFNVWFRIWPAQKQIITAVKSGQAPDAALVALAGGRSKHNTYMSVPLIWTMINQHTTTTNVGQPGISLLLAIALGWWVVMLLYKKSAAVKGF